MMPISGSVAFVMGNMIQSHCFSVKVNATSGYPRDFIIDVFTAREAANLEM